MHIQQLDYEQLPFKCKVCHEYGHFANRCSKQKVNEVEHNEEIAGGSWEQVKRKKHSSNPGTSSTTPLATNLPPPPPPPSTTFPSSSNPFESLTAELSSSPPQSPHPTSPCSNPPPSPPPTIERILTRNKAKEVNQPTDPPRKVGRKSNKELRDETTAKEMATGTQQPMD